MEMAWQGFCAAAGRQHKIRPDGKLGHRDKHHEDTLQDLPVVIYRCISIHRHSSALDVRGASSE
jgi:hypothetical protein